MRERIGYERLPTERANRASRALDRPSPLEIAVLRNREDQRAVAAVGRVTRATAAAVGLIVGALRRGGRLIFVGAGTSGRLGVLEAAECPPTFNTPPGLVQAVMAGGRASVFRSREGAEDDARDAVRRLRARARRGDVVVGISASGVTPFVRAALRVARARGCRTVLVVCHPSRSLRGVADVLVAPAPGPEVLAGSTRLKAGTATKLVLNTLTTASMARLGKVYGNRMVDVQPRSRKLRARAARLVAEIVGVSPALPGPHRGAVRGRARLPVGVAPHGVAPRAGQRLRRPSGAGLRARPAPTYPPARPRPPRGVQAGDR